MRERATPPPLPTILLAEADGSLRGWLGLLLAEAGYRVLTAGTGPEVLQHLRGHERIDLVVTNTRVGRLPGWEIAQLTSEFRPGVPMVRMIQSRADALPIYGFDPDSVVLLQKPFTIIEMEHAVRTLLARRSASVSAADRLLRHA